MHPLCYGLFLISSLIPATASSVVLFLTSNPTCFALSNPSASKASRNIFCCINGSHPAIYSLSTSLLSSKTFKNWSPSSAQSCGCKVTKSTSFSRRIAFNTSNVFILLNDGQVPWQTQRINPFLLAMFSPPYFLSPKNIIAFWSQIFLQPLQNSTQYSGCTTFGLLSGPFS